MPPLAPSATTAATAANTDRPGAVPAPAPVSLQHWGPGGVLAADLPLPALHDVFRAREVVDRFLPPTPLLRPPALAERLGCDLYLKCENLQPIGAFKVRGGLYLLSQLPPEQRARGVVTASTGNHGQSIAYAARAFETRATVVVPEGANPLKVGAMRRLAAEVVFAGRDFDESVATARALADERGATFVHSANDPALIAGVATSTLEIVEAVPDLDVLIVPVGGGSGLCGACVAGKGINPGLRVVGAQAVGAPAVHDAWRRRELVAHERMETFAEGLATRVAFALPARILWEQVDDIRLVSDAEMKRAILTLLETARLLAEGAGAAALAVAFALREELAGRKVAVVLSGGNLTLETLADVLASEVPW